jgi:regulator of replication initiation timing
VAGTGNFRGIEMSDRFDELIVFEQIEELTIQLQSSYLQEIQELRNEITKLQEENKSLKLRKEGKGKESD